MIQKEATLLCPYFSWGTSVSMEASGLRAEIRSSSFNAIPVKAPFMGKPLWKRIGKGPPQPEHWSPPSFPEYLHPLPPEHKPACIDTQHRGSCCLCRCHCSFAFPSIRRLEGRKTMATHHDFLWTNSLQLQAAQTLNLSQLLRSYIRTWLAHMTYYPI